MATASPPARFDAPDAYTPRHLAERILTSKEALEGERKQVTALFADLKGSMELFIDRDPEEARRLLDPVIEQMMEAVHRYEGTVNHVLGDGIVALFGAPLAHEDHAVRACYAALRMQDTIQRYAHGVLHSEGIPIRIRVGLDSGEVVVRTIGSDLRMDYTVLGQTVNVAARMEQMALPGSILISSNTLALAEGYIQVKPLGPIKVKGLDDPLEVYEMTEASTVRSRLHAAAARGLTRFVGRVNELDLLRRALERARNGHGQVVAVVGEAGVGKSRLYWEFTHSHRAAGWLVVESSSVSYGKATSFLPIIDLLKGYFQIEAGDEPRRKREKLTGRLLSLDRALESSLPALLWLLDLPVEDPQWQRLDPPQRHQRALEGVKRLLLRESQVQPVLVLFEDLHWIDAETQALLDSLVESLPTARLLLLVNYRPEYQQAWSGKTYYRQLSMDPLPPESADELLADLLGTDPGLQPLKDLLIARTEGNPFFLEESVRTLFEAKALAGERGAYRLATEPQTLQIPVTVQAILAARIDRLAPEDKRLLQAAAVIGKDVPFALLQSIAQLSEEDLRRGLAHLQSAEFLYETRLFPDLEYTFKHALTHDVAYGSLLHDRRRALHAKIVETIERLYPNRLPEHIDSLAHHALQGEVWDKAVSYLRQAGAKAAARSALREAMTYFEQALRALSYLPESRETLEQAVDLRVDFRQVLFPLGEHGRGFQYLHQAEALAEKLGDQSRRGRIAASMNHYFWQAGAADRAVIAGERAVEIAETVGDLGLQIDANFHLGLAYASLGNYRQALERFGWIMRSLAGELIRERFGMTGLPSVFARSWSVMCLAELGEFTEGIAPGEEAVRIAEGVDHPFSLIRACLQLGTFYQRKGEFPKAIPLLERSLGLCQSRQIPFLFPWVAAALGYTYALAGRINEAVPLLEQAAERDASMLVAHQSIRAAYLGETYLLAGRRDDATRCAQNALDLSRQHQERGHQAWVLRLLGEIASCSDSPALESASSHYREALALAEELDMRPLVAHCHLGLGKLSMRIGELEHARENLTAAKTMYRDLNLAFWLEQEGARDP
jgi:class 3 adenylate cyclase/tetratricopeptide (TPR) repeat protein